ncbi:MAG: hypothetical protein WEF50_09715 [Myxococcota bacterium]
MKTLVLAVLIVAMLAVVGGASTSDEYADFLPLKAAPEHHKPLLENEFVLVLDVSIPAGATVPAHLHPWPAVFVTLQPAHLVFRNFAAEVVREVRPPVEAVEKPKVEWRERDSEPASVTNVGTTELRALRIELKFLAR